jgi:phosphate transport system substrate-binding protein
MGLSIVDQRGDNVWPVSTASFIIMYRNPENKKDSQEALKFFDWAFRNGAKMSEELDYVHLPVSLQEQIRQKVWSQIQK